MSQLSPAHHRHAGVAGRRYGAALRKAPRDYFEIEPLVQQRHANVPTKRAKQERGIGASQIVELYWHFRPLCVRTFSIANLAPVALKRAQLVSLFSSR